MGPLEVLSLDSTRRIMEVNLLGTIQTIQAFLPDMKAQGRGHILVTGSTGGLHGELSNCPVSCDVCQRRSTRAGFIFLSQISKTDPCLCKSALFEIAKTTPGAWGAVCSPTGLPFNEVYCASKFAIEGACESLAVLLQHFKIQ